MRETESTDDGNRWEWLKRGELKREIGSLLCAAQEQALRVNVIKYLNDKTNDTLLCRLYNEKTHTVSACSTLAKSQYRKRHNKVGTYVHWLLCKNYHLQCSGKLYIHASQPVQENSEYKILWDFNIQTDKVIEHRPPYLVCINKQKRECHNIKFAIPVDQNIVMKEWEKIDKYQDLRIELQKIWNVKVVVIPIVTGALGTISERIYQYIKQIDISVDIISIQKAANVRTPYILRRVLGI